MKIFTSRARPEANYCGFSSPEIRNDESWCREQDPTKPGTCRAARMMISHEPSGMNAILSRTSSGTKSSITGAKKNL